MRDGQEEDEAPHTAGGSGCRAHPEGSRWGCGRRPGRGRPQWSARLGTLSPDTRSFPCAATATAPPRRYTDIPFIFLIFQTDNPQLALPPHRDRPQRPPQPRAGLAEGSPPTCAGTHGAQRGRTRRPAPLRSAVTAPPRAAPGPSPPAARSGAGGSAPPPGARTLCTASARRAPWEV